MLVNTSNCLRNGNTSKFSATILRPAQMGDTVAWGFIVLPKEISETLPRRGRTSIDGSINGYVFQATLEPDGQLSHWLKLTQPLLDSAGVQVGESANFSVKPVGQEPEPEVPQDLQQALVAHPNALATWQDTTTIARLDWIHWITSAKQAKTRLQRISNACDMLASGKKRVCCFDPSGFYSKAFSAPKTA